ncbi:MAG: glycine cleavage system aminomethyltransferase T, partial [Porticoccaceae bacterium]
MSQESKTAAIPFGARVRKSPFFDSTRKDGAKAFSVYNHMYFPTSYAGTESEYDSLINDVTMWDVAVERQIEINGPDAYEFIRRLTPRNLEKCEIGRCLYVILTGHNGGAINDAVLLRLKPDQFWLSPGDGDVLLWIQGVAINSGFDVNVFEPDVSPLGICGPKAPALINKLFDGEHDDLRFYQARETSLAGIPMVIARTGWSGEISYELYLRDGKRGDALWAVVKDAGQEFNIAPAAPNTIRSIEGGLLSYVSDITRNDCPYTIGLDRLVDVDQDIDFIGKEALKKIKENGPARKLVGIEIAGDPITSAPEQPWPVFSG